MRRRLKVDARTMRRAGVSLGFRPDQDDLEAERIRRAAWSGLAEASVARPRIDRYEVLGLAGSGGMGVVYRALDTRLERTVAIKLVRPDKRGGSRDRLSRLRAEARTLAQVHDPRIVPVFDVGVVDRELFIVMAFVEGESLAHWLGGERTVSEILGVFTEAAKGLAAAHAAGIVHRDFKPGNVIVEPAGSVLVVDFGLAHFVGRDDGDTLRSFAAHPAEPSSTQRLTETGTVVGTPKYMAPEQRRGDRVDGRADQYAFCISLQHALADRDVPPHVRRVIARGLSRDPADRFASMLALVRALQSRPAPLQLTFALGIGGCALIAIPLAPEASADCPATVALEATWGPARAEELRVSLLRHGAAGREAWDRVGPRVDAFASAYADATERACEDGEDSPAARCVAADRRRLSGLLHAIERADREHVVGAVEALRRLAEPRSCLDKMGDQPHVPTDPTLREQVVALRSAVDRGHASLALADHDTAWSAAAASLRESDRIAYPPARLDALLLAGKVQSAREFFAEGRALLGEAYALAHQLHDDEAAVEAALGVARAFEKERDPERALVWLRHAEAALHRAGDPPLHRARLAALRGRALSLAERHSEARGWYASALDTIEEHDPEHVLVGLLMGGLAGAEASLGRRAEAEALMRPALARVERDWGAHHPHVALAASSLASAIGSRHGDVAEAIALGERAYAIVEQTFGSHSASIVAPAHNLARSYMLAERFDEAEAKLRQAVAGARTISGVGPMRSVEPLLLLASLAYTRGRYEEAAEAAREAIAAAELTHQLEAQSSGRIILARALMQLGEPTAAVEEGRRGLERTVALLGARHSRTLIQQAQFAQLLRRADLYEDSIALADETLRALAAAHDPAPLLQVRLLGLTALAFAELEQPAPSRDRFRRAVDKLLATPEGGERPRVACEMIRFGRHIQGADSTALDALCL